MTQPFDLAVIGGGINGVGIARDASGRGLSVLLVEQGDLAGARERQDKLIGLHKALFLDASPSPTKFALAHLGLCAEDARLPIAPCAEAAKPAILEAMRAAGVA